MLITNNKSLLLLHKHKIIFLIILSFINNEKKQLLTDTVINHASLGGLQGGWGKVKGGSGTNYN